MIVAITKGNSVKGLINYHEKKVERGNGELILDSTLSQNKHERISSFVDLAELNKSVKKDRYTHMSISFSEEDRVDRATQLKIAERYLHGMGYADAPRLIYEHYDTAKTHFHIVTSTIDLNGKKIQVFRDHYRNQELSRQIEKEFGLKVTEYFRQEQYKLQEVNAAKFSLLKGVEKILSSPENRMSLEKVVDPQLIEKIVNEKLSNDEVKKILSAAEEGDKKFDELYRIVRLSNAEYKTEKQLLRERLNYIKSLSKSRDEFVHRCEQQGIYVRKIGGESGSARFTYGLKDKNFYVVEKDLPVALRHDYLFTNKQISNSYDEVAQKKFVKRIVTRCLRNASSRPDFETKLYRAGVRVEYASNARGIYGVSFKSFQLKEAITIKGSDIGLSWSKLATHQFTADPALRKLTVAKAINIKPSTAVAKALDTSDDDEDGKRKKRDYTHGLE